MPTISIRQYIRAIYQVVGNKRYMHDIEGLFRKIEESIDITASERQALQLLARDLESVRNESDRNSRKARQWQHGNWLP